VCVPVAKKSPLAVYNHKGKNGNGYIKITQGWYARKKKTVLGMSESNVL
jgi:hypothetical protein